MKKTMTTMLVWALLLCCASIALAEQPTALDAFNALLAEDNAALASFKTSAEWLDDIMTGKYSAMPQDAFEAATLAPDLEGLCGITNGDLAAYASLHGMNVAQLRNAYYKALANVLMAEIMVNPASEEKYQNVQTILALFLETETDADTAASKAAIRGQMSPEYSQKLARQANLPPSFVEFVIMDESWNDENWENDDDWREAAQWRSLLEDGFDDITIGSRDAGGSTRIADMQEILISLGYLKGKADGVFGPRTQSALLEFQLANGMAATGVYSGEDYSRLQATDAVARWEYDDDFWDSQDFDTYNSPNTPDTNNTPDTPDTPKQSKASSKKDTPDSPDSPDTPKQSGSKQQSSKQKSAKRNSPDSPDSRDSD